ncbi:DUF1254 domain-containing protein [Rhizobium sp. 57MFTsu3.2]|uniref:DUF1254 domain-containing protein n=1 Tax=Rhizobium sp. 57MFTsu3.2 TaxID=1048681 RepID=UPI00146D53C5|nr:DUF1254 domain-containing protein [Rhizobium sp. 57MFTsu3.2]NMN71294.1 hypothetical protein [Rhizobium sp. 57MFTsu3.2]
MRLFHLASVATLCFGAGMQAARAADMPVTVDNFTRAETDLYFNNALKDAGGTTGKFGHHREPMSIDHQTVVRPNRDTLYSVALIDLEAGPVTVTLPDAGTRFRSLQIINEDHYLVGDEEYDAGSYTYTRDQAGTRYILVGLRTLVDPNSPDDIQQVHSLQDATKVSQTTAGKFEAPQWDTASQKKVRDALLVLGSTIPDFKGAFGAKDKVDPIRHLIGTAAGWGGNPEHDATYLNVTPPKNDGKTIYRLSVRDVPVDGFWSISVYNSKGYFEKNKLNAYTLNNITAAKAADGSINVQFGDCDKTKVENCIPTMAGWNYTVRLYRPRAQVLDGSWTFPQAMPSAQ